MSATDLMDVFFAITVISSSVADYFRMKRSSRLEKENERMKNILADSMDGDESIPRFAHDWGQPKEEIAYVSKNPLSNDVVAIHTVACHKCQMVHRYIVRGALISQRKGLDIEGFYLSGIKVCDRGCPTDYETVEVFEAK